MHALYGISGGAMINVVALSVVYRGFEPRFGQNAVKFSGMCCFSAIKHAL